MRVVDTSAWIEWLAGSPLRARLALEIPERTRCLVPTIVQLELAKWLIRESGEAQADLVEIYSAHHRPDEGVMMGYTAWLVSARA